MWFGLFLAEGGMLNRRVVYENQELLWKQVHEVELSYPGLPTQLHEPFLQMLRANLGKLNECREKVLWAKMKS
jgi:hypothetical protein